MATKLTPEQKARAEKYAKLTRIDIESMARSLGKEAAIFYAKKVKETEEYPIYPKVEVVKADGSKTWKYDTKAAPIGTKTKNIPFTKVKHDFCAKYAPELLPEKQEATGTMQDSLAALMAEFGITEEDLK